MTEKRDQRPDPLKPITANGLPPELEAVDFSQFKVWNRNERGPELSLQTGRYQADTSVSGAALIQDVAKDRGVGVDKPDLLYLMRIKGSTDFVAYPVLEEGPTTIKVNWRKDGGAAVDMRSLSAVQRFPIPDRHRGHLPLSRQDLLGVGHCLVIHYSQSFTTPIKPGRSRKKSAGDQQSTVATSANPTDQPSTKPASGDASAPKDVA
jgi:hypothetical protein